MTDAPIAPVDTVASGRYRLVELIGTGGVATVWRGHDRLLDRDVAIKIAEPAAADPETPMLLLSEAKAAARLRNPHIAEVYDVGAEPLPGGRTASYVVMELIDGVTLKAMIEPGQRLPWRQATGIIAQTAQALAVAHAQGIAHRDVSAANVMLTHYGVKVLDFGLAAAHGSPERDADGFVRGSVRYTAPERIAEPDRPVHAAGDVYSLGVLWYRLLAGQFPWRASNAEEAVAAHLEQPPQPLPDSIGLPADLAELCLRCLAKQPHRRPTAAEVAQRLSGLATTTSPEAAAAVAIPGPVTSPPAPITSPPAPTTSPPAPSDPRRSRAVLIGVFVGLLLALLLGAGWLSDGRSPGDKPDNAGPGASPPAGGGGTATVTQSPRSGGATTVPGGPGGAIGSKPGPTADASGSGSGNPGGGTTPTGDTALQVTISGTGGVVVAICTGPLGGLVLVISAVPNAGFVLVTSILQTPADIVQVIFRSLQHTTEIRLTCDAGVMNPAVTES